MLLHGRYLLSDVATDDKDGNGLILSPNFQVLKLCLEKGKIAKNLL